MCGIYGWKLSEDTPKDKIEKLAMSLPILNTERGRDSWGVFLCDSDKILKAVGIITEAGIDAIARRPVVLGHTRQASHGAVTKANAHPFRFGPVVGAHNGVIYNHQELNERHSRKFEVDSMHIFSHFADGKDTGDIQGYGAVWWYDKRDERIHLAKFGGVLAVAGVEQNGKHLGIVFSSDERHLDVALKFARLKSFEYQVEERKNHWIGKDGKLYVQGKVNIAKRESRLEMLLGTHEDAPTPRPDRALATSALSSALDTYQKNASKEKTPTNKNQTYTVGTCEGCETVTAIYPVVASGHKKHLCRTCLYTDRSAAIADEDFGIDGV